MTVDISCNNQKVAAKVQVQKGAPVHLLIGTDLLPRLGFVFLQTDSDGSAVDCLSKHKWRRHDESDTTPTPNDAVVAEDHPRGTVKLITTTRLPARHT